MSSHGTRADHPQPKGNSSSPEQPHDIEAAAISTAPPVVAQPVLEQPTRIIYVAEAPVYAQYNSPYVLDDVADPHPGLLGCAIIGFIFSWIPIIGFITYCINFDAPLNSQRRLFAHMACLIAMIVLLFNIFFWSFY